MCGFAGIWINNKRNTFFTEKFDVLRTMLLMQKHRGPDDSGIAGIDTASKSVKQTDIDNKIEFAENDDLLLGFNRLSILDLSKNGHQPMLSADGKVMIVFNGEIYNAFDYKNDLLQKGYNFKSKTDTEIILNLYIEYGIDEMLRRLNGMFAIGIYDFDKKKLFLTRDRFGIKPLYLLKTSDYITFSSEIKSFKALPDYKLKLDKTKLDEFLLFRYLVNNTLFEDIVNCLPGTYTEIDANGNVKTTTYYNLNEEGKHKLDELSIKNSFISALNESVKSQMISDVKLGCQLSGGIDSSLITYFAQKSTSERQLETISVIFDDQEFSEKKWIDEVVEKLKLFSHQFIMDGHYFYNELNKVIWHFENPISHPNAIGIYLLSKEAKKHVTVLLSGEGADECFGGYYKFITKFSSKKNHFKRLIKHIIKKKFNLKNIDWSYYLFSNDEDSGFILTSAFGSKKIAKSVYPLFDYRKALKARKKIISKLTGDTFTRKRKFEMLTYLPELLLRQDKMSMAHSIENRVPFLDNHIVSLALSIPESALIGQTLVNGVQKTETKLMLKKICSEIFSEKFAYRSKSGFNIPEVEFMSSLACQSAWNSVIKPGIEKRGLFNAAELDRIMKNVSVATSDEITTLFLMYSFEIWAQQYID